MTNFGVNVSISITDHSIGFTKEKENGFRKNVGQACLESNWYTCDTLIILNYYDSSSNILKLL